MSAGIDYGLGRTNIDHKTGIRYGVIRINSLYEWIYEDLESDYGKPHCPCCGLELSDDEIETCPNCKHEIRDSSCCYPDEPLYQYIDDGTYKAESGDGIDLFITKSPYYTLASFCSPCAPGAGHLNCPNPDGVKTYCLGHEMFDDEKAPYPVYSVETNEEIKP